jgi:class 3 adenylate cyclase
MAKLSLKNIIRKKNEASLLIHSLIGELKADVFIEDNEGKLLIGTPAANPRHQQPVTAEDELIGWVKGDEKTIIVAQFLNHLVQKEAEKKKLGSEVLNLYQEVNLMYNFSDKLAQTIDASDISTITLDEASRVIRSDNGVVVLWDEENRVLEVMAVIGESFFDRGKINSDLPVLLNIITSGQSEIISDTSSLVEAGIVLPHIRSVIYSALKVKRRVMGAIILASNDPVQYIAADLKLLTTLALQSSAAIESALLYQKNIREANEREEAMRRIYEATNKFVPYEFIQSLGRDVITDVRLGDQVEKIVTVLFSDIRNYTTLSEQMTPEENFRFVGSFNEHMGPIIRKHKGFINQYLGDAIMAIFPGNAADALAAAVEMQIEVQQFNREQQLKNEPEIQIGVGMHTGPLIMGITGDNDRMDATTISDTVNTSSRLESLTKYYKAGILLSDATLQQIVDPKTFYLRHLGLVQLKGKLEPIRVYECFNGNPQQELQNKMASLAIFNKGMFHYLNKSFEEAAKAFQEVAELDPDDSTAAFFYSKTKQAIATGIPDNWIGVVEMQNK